MNYTHLRVATYNVKDLIGEQKSFDKFSNRRSKSESEIQSTAKTLEEVSADVAGLQEVEKHQLLNKLLAASANLAKKYPSPVMQEGRSFEHIDTALISKYPVIKMTSHKNYPLKSSGKKGIFTHNLLETEIKTPIGNLTVFDTHLKGGKDNEASQPIKEAEANGVKDIIANFKNKYPAKLFIITGDLNDTEASQTLKTLMGAGLYNPTENLPQYKKNTHCTGKQYDYILLHPALAPYVHSTHVHHSKSANEASDHNPLVLDLLFPPGFTLGTQP